jgi:hypothetical protein
MEPILTFTRRERPTMTLIPLVVLWFAMAGVQTSPAPSGPPALRVTSDVLLPKALNLAADVRWATEHSVYLGLGGDGALEVSIEPPGQKLRELIPARSRPGGFFASHQVAASSEYMVAAGYGLVLGWRRLEEPTRTDVPLEFIQAIDVWRDKVLVVGARRDAKGNFASDGAIAWLGSLDKKLSDQKPILYDSTGPGDRAMNACGFTHLGAARFFTDGSFVVLPGIQPGLNFFDRNGKMIRTVDTAALGIDSDCGNLTKEQWERIGMNFPARMAWVNQRRTVDAMLLFPQGPGLVIRSVENHRVRWRLEVVKSDGKTVSYQVPISAPDEFFHLRGDVRDGKIVFVLRQTPPSDRNYAQPHLITALVPEG